MISPPLRALIKTADPIPFSGVFTPLVMTFLGRVCSCVLVSFAFFIVCGVGMWQFDKCLVRISSTSEEASMCGLAATMNCRCLMNEGGWKRRAGSFLMLTKKSIGCMSKIALGCFLKFGSLIGAGGKCFRAFEMSGVAKFSPRRLVSVGVVS